MINWYLESLQDGKLKPIPERFATMSAEVRHLQHIVEELRTLSLADAGQLKLHLESTSIPELLARVVEANQPDSERSGCTLRLTFARSIMEIHGGSLSTVSRLGIGSCRVN